SESLGVLSEDPLRVTLDFDQLLEDLERVAPDVQVVIRVLLDPFELLELGQENGDESGAIHEAETAQRVVRRDEKTQLVVRALRRNPRERLRLRAGELERARIDLEVELARETGQPHRPQGVLPKRFRADRAQAAAVEIG